jgi:dolichol kinase
VTYDAGFERHLTPSREIKRKLFHLLGLILPAGYSYLGPETARPLMLIGLACVVLLDLARLYWPLARSAYSRFFASLSRDSERHQLTGATQFMAAQTFCAFVFPPEIAPVAMVFGVVGDVAAAVVGKTLGGPEWRRGKTIAGSIGCFCASFAVGMAWMTLGWETVLIGAVAATLAEALVTRVNDNLVVPTLGGAAMWIAVALGW